ncbi:helix-turn-helix domain-containing protein [Latilactobacillus curvatus]|uniref:helix-turn-helix domain-containing protein n=1 Tax=Latilactobacillus curvatus TaxID=28038 RepID=UPI000FECD505|nr:helix-turn-helix transcriptional regulator [Latilactobacillus curvatus]QAR35235.1 XRE family transcriptional regulator [Latilactobacillus curvatus]
MTYAFDLSLIRKKRLDKGYSMEKMSKLLGLENKSMYYKREIGATQFKATEIPLLASLLEVSVEKIFVKTLRK